MTTEQEADAIWATLSPQAKAGWVAAMMPQPQPEPPIVNPDDVKAVVTGYVRRVEANTGPHWNARQDVLDAIHFDGGGEAADTRVDVIYEMLAVAGDMGMYVGDDDEAADAWWDAIEAALPAVAAALT